MLEKPRVLHLDLQTAERDCLPEAARKGGGLFHIGLSLSIGPQNPPPQWCTSSNKATPPNSATCHDAERIQTTTTSIWNWLQEPSTVFSSLAWEFCFNYMQVFCFLFCFVDTGFLYSSGYPGTQKFACLSLPSAEIKVCTTNPAIYKL